MITQNGSDASGIEVSYVILNLNQPALTLQCVASIVKSARLDYEIIVVDNGSREAEFEQLKKGLDSDVRLIRLLVNMYFGEGNNIAVEAARGKYVLFLNNDVEVQSDIAAELIRHFNHSFAAGAIGPTLLFPSGQVQESGGFILEDGHSLRVGRLVDVADNALWRGVKIVDYCSAACLLMERETFVRLGGFDPWFDPAYYEDADLCFRLRAAGLFVYVATQSSVVHYENSTSSVEWGMDRVHRVVDKNREQFLSRWGKYLAQRLADDMCPTINWPAIKPMSGSRSVGDGSPRILIPCDRPIDVSSRFSALLELIWEAQSKCDITLAVPELCSRLRLQMIERHLGLSLPNLAIARASEVDVASFDGIIECPLGVADDGAFLRSLVVMKEAIYKIVSEGRPVERS